jgi:PKD repeat protein
LVEAYELFGCNNAELFVLSISCLDNDAQCIAYDEEHGVEHPTISDEQGGGDIADVYGIEYCPTYLLIAPDHTIVEQGIWPVSSAQTFVDVFESHGIEQSDCDVVLGAGFSADVTELCTPDNTVNFHDQSSGNPTSWNWTFEGGNPASSTEEHPTVVYDSPGVYSVTLEVSNGDEINELVMEDYITINEGVDVVLSSFSDVCVNWAAFELTGGYPYGGTYSGTGVVDGMFDPAIAGVGTHTITYSYTAPTGCFGEFSQDVYVDACIGIDNPSEQNIRVYPNPSSGHVDLDVYHVGTVDVKVYSVTGAKVYSATETANGHYQFNMDLTDLNNGIYYVVVTSGSNVERLKLERVD